MAENDLRSIIFPSMNPTGEAKLKRIVETIADYMGTKILIETVIVMKISYPEDRMDIEAILKRLAGNKTGLNLLKAGNLPKTEPPAEA